MAKVSDRYSQSMEDYLKAIYDLSVDHGRVTTNQLAERLDVTPASVTGMLKKMASGNPPLVVHHKHYGVELTPAGERAALQVIRHHRLLELFLQRTLGYSWDQVHSEADRLEHVISEEFEERIAEILDNPGHDPHGEPIPNRDLQLPEQSGIQLSDLRPGQNAMIERVHAYDNELLRYFGVIGLVPGAQITVLDYSPYDENLQLRIRGREVPIVLGPRVTEQVFVVLNP
jgi:DtxR family Mn-dependent transcriptional regulator